MATSHILNSIHVWDFHSGLLKKVNSKTQLYETNNITPFRDLRHDHICLVQLEARCIYCSLIGTFCTDGIPVVQTTQRRQKTNHP